MIGVIDYGAGNTRSVLNALESLGTRGMLSSSPSELEQCDGLLLPGVGSAASAMQTLQTLKLVAWLRQCELPLLGICLGMQLLFESSQEGDVATLGLLPGTVVKLREPVSRVPHMGWNTLNNIGPSPLLEGVSEGDYVYFAHSYAAQPGPDTLSQTESFASSVQRGRIYGTQFHPEKSGRVGLRILKNFEALCRSSQPWI